MLIAQIKDLNVSKYHVPIFYAFGEISRQIELWSGQFLILNDSASPKMIIKMHFIFFKGFIAV